MKTIIPLVIAMALSFPLSAQIAAGLYYNQLQGISKSTSDIGALPQGVSGLFLYRLNGSAWSIGGELGTGIHSDRQYGYTFKDKDYGWVTTDVKEAETVSWLNVLARYHFVDNTAIEPYAEGRMGIIALATVRCVGTGNSIYTGDEVMDASEVRDHIERYEQDALNFHAGLGLGAIINLKKLVCETFRDYGFELKLDTGVSYGLSTANSQSANLSGEVQASGREDIVHDLGWRLGLMLGF